MRNNTKSKLVKEKWLIYRKLEPGLPRVLSFFFSIKIKTNWPYKNLSHDSCLLSGSLSFPIPLLLPSDSEPLIVACVNASTQNDSIIDLTSNCFLAKWQTLNEFSLVLNECWMTLWTADWLRLKSAKYKSRISSSSVQPWYYLILRVISILNFSFCIL